MMLADTLPTAPATSDIGMFVLCAAVFIGMILSLIAIGSYFATRREMDDVKERMTNIEDLMEKRTEKLHKRINRLLAGQMLIAGKVGVALDKHQSQMDDILRELESEED